MYQEVSLCGADYSKTTLNYGNQYVKVNKHVLSKFTDENFSKTN